jgi:hypothetical protein
MAAALLIINHYKPNIDISEGSRQIPVRISVLPFAYCATPRLLNFPNLPHSRGFIAPPLLPHPSFLLSFSFSFSFSLLLVTFAVGFVNLPQLPYFFSYRLLS